MTPAFKADDSIWKKNFRPISDKEGVNFDSVKTKLKSIALSAFYGYDSEQLPLNISKAELSALNRLCKNKDIVIIRPDKGNGVVILNRPDYVNKVETLLADSSKFKKLDCDMLEICQKKEGKLIRFLRDTLQNQKFITDEVYRDLYPSGSTPSILYGLPKIHKENCPFCQPLVLIIANLLGLSFLSYSLLQSVNTRSKIHSVLSLKLRLSKKIVI